MHKIILQMELDERLGVLAGDPERFADACLELAETLDTEGGDLEVRDSQDWRRGETPTRAKFADQFRADVDSMLPMDREEEARLARRIEFAHPIRETRQTVEAPIPPNLLRIIDLLRRWRARGSR